AAGVSEITLIVIVAVELLPKPALVLFCAAATSRLNVLTELERFALGVNFRPALPCAIVMKSLLLIGVVPLFWNNVPFVMFVILKTVMSTPTAAFFVMTKPELVCVSSLVVALVTPGGSPTDPTVIVAVAKPLLSPVPVLSIEPCTWKLPLPEKFKVGVNFKPALPSAKVMN